MILLYRRFLLWLLLLLAGIIAMLTWTQAKRLDSAEHLNPQRATLVRQLALTDLALWSEARYTRHPSQADLFTPFQEFPGSMEHFPAGSLINPPPRVAETVLKVRRKGQKP